VTGDAPGNAPSTRQDVGALVRELKATLDQIGDALVNGTFDDLIATESRLAGIAGGFSQVLGDPPSMPTAPPSELDAALAALRRCQRLGSSFTDVGTSWLGVGEANAYTRSGRSPVRLTRVPKTTIDMRV
jgi:hypothetical protein